MDLKKIEENCICSHVDQTNKNNITLSRRDIHEYEKVLSSHPLIFNKSSSSDMNLYWKMQLYTFIYAYSKMQVLQFVVYMPSNHHVTDLKPNEIQKMKKSFDYFISLFGKKMRTVLQHRVTRYRL